MYLMEERSTSISSMLPSKKVVVLLVVLLLAGGFYLWVSVDSQSKPKLSTKENFSQVKSSSQAITYTEKDTDGDGLKDWEEALWGTNPDMADTDGDGTPDGEEVSLKRNPAVAGPNDRIEEIGLAPSTIKFQEENENLTPTEIASREFFARYLQMKSSGSFGSTSANDLSNSFAKEVFQNTSYPNPTKHSSGELLLIQNPTNTDRKKYGNDVGIIFEKYGTSNGIAGNEPAIALKAYQNDNPAILNEIDKGTAIYGQIIRDLLGLPVPSDAAYVHIQVINVFEALRTQNIFLKRGFTDPVSFAFGVDNYTNVYKDFLEAFASANDYFTLHNIAFEDAETGSLFVNSVTRTP